MKIHTPTQESYDKLMEKLEKQGYMWNDNEKPTDVNNWGEEGKETCINIENEETCPTIKVQNTLSFCYKKWYKDKGYKIISVEEYLVEWKQGDILVDKDGIERKILGICGEVYIISEGDDFSKANNPYTKEELKGMGFGLKEEKDTVGVNIMGDNICISTEVFCRDITKKSARELRNKLNNLNLI